MFIATTIYRIYKLDGNEYGKFYGIEYENANIASVVASLMSNDKCKYVVRCEYKDDKAKVG